jgi:Xaa-Pro aminopeptidase
MPARFQNFESTANPTLAAPRVASLRALFDAHGIDGFLVPRSDEHQGEYVAKGSERLAWLTGFTGSAGVALVLKSNAFVFVDGRYTVQAGQQLDPETFSAEDLVATPPAKWIKDSLPKGARIGFDPWLHTVSEVKGLEKALADISGALVAVKANPVDAVWHDRRAAPLEPVTIHDIAQAGVLAADKIAAMGIAVAESGASACVLTDPSSAAWVFNIRGKDVPHTPLALCFAILRADGEPLLFLDRRKLPIKTEAYLNQLCALHPPSALEEELGRLAANGASIALDPALAADQLRRIVESAGGKVIEASDPARIPRAQKNRTELAGTRAAHIRDGAAVSSFLAWCDGREPGTLTEIAAAEKLEACRVQTGEMLQAPLLDISFDTISSTGPNGAINHYRVTKDTNRTLQDGELFLLDSGGQYVDGTTDITRTMPVGTVSDEMRRRFTLVLKGMIAVSTLRFPKGTAGADIDAFARSALWKAGLDYAHGTGHGVGSYLSVHEGPQRIAKTGRQELLPGMILSNEPGYYKPGEYGIRIENLIVVSGPQDIAGGDKPMLGFETITLAPIDRRLTDTHLLTREELQWLDAYHARVLTELSPLVEASVRPWLENACAPLEHHARSGQGGEPELRVQ